MRAALEHTLNAVWYEGRHAWLSTLLRPLSSGLQYIARRNWRTYAPQRATPLPVPVVVVGNIVAGGSGKTPVTQALALALTARGLKVGIVSRGYGGTRKAASLVDATKPDEFGDEPCLLASSTDCAVAVAAARREAVELLCSRYELDIILSDDGMQHASLHRDFEVCVLGPRGLGNQRLIPAGPLREPSSRLNEVNWILNWGKSYTNPAIKAPQSTIVGAHGNLQMLNGAPAPESSLKSLAVLQSKRLLPLFAAAGLAQPNRFYVSLGGAGLVFKILNVPDHGMLTEAQLARVPHDGLLLVTEKDAVKLRAAQLKATLQKRIRVVPWHVVVPEALVDKICALRINPKQTLDLG